jgi:hypothetical protein
MRLRARHARAGRDAAGAAVYALRARDEGTRHTYHSAWRTYEG